MPNILIFYKRLIAENHPHDELTKKNISVNDDDWLCESLLDKLAQFYPSAENVTHDHLNHDNVMESTPFAKKCGNFFGYHREFLNCKQIQQAAEILCLNFCGLFELNPSFKVSDLFEN